MIRRAIRVSYPQVGPGGIDGPNFGRKLTAMTSFTDLVDTLAGAVDALAEFDDQPDLLLDLALGARAGGLAGLDDALRAMRPDRIVGVAGLLGAGRDVLVDLLYGLRPAERGTIHLDGRPRRIRTPKQAIRAGMALVPRDRRHQGLILPFTTADNINLASLPETATFGWERRGIAEQKARDWIEQLAIRPGRPGLPVRYMSGGNQQKAILARWLGTDARLFILDEPTLGVDIGARRDIYQRTRQLADQGRAVLVSSSDAPELLGLCDRILVLWRGALAANLPTRGLTLDALLVAINGGQEPSL